MSKPNKYVPGIQRPLIHIALLCGTERDHWIHPKLHHEIARWIGTEARARISHSLAYGIFPVSSARNRTVRDIFLPSSTRPDDWLIMLDNDVLPPPNFLDMIFEAPADADILIPPYFVWDPNEHKMQLCVGTWSDGKMLPFEQMRAGDWVECGAGGTGCIAIKRRVFTEDRIAEPWFKIIMSDYEFQLQSEDIYFTSAAHEAGYKIYTNGLYLCSHYHTHNLADLHLGNMQILNRFFDATKQKYGDIGITIQSLSREINKPGTFDDHDKMAAEANESPLAHLPEGSH